VQVKQEVFVVQVLQGGSHGLQEVKA